MPYTMNWYIENEVLYMHFSGTTTPEEFYNSLLDTKRFIDGSPRNWIHIIIDVGNVTQPLPPKDALRIVREVGTHERAGWQILLREKSLLVRLGVAFSTSLFKGRTKTLDTMDEVNAFLKEIDTHLNWEKKNSSILLS